MKTTLTLLNRSNEVINFTAVLRGILHFFFAAFATLATQLKSIESLLFVLKSVCKIELGAADCHTPSVNVISALVAMSAIIFVKEETKGETSDLDLLFQDAICIRFYS